MRLQRFLPRAFIWGLVVAGKLCTGLADCRLVVTYWSSLAMQDTRRLPKLAEQLTLFCSGKAPHPFKLYGQAQADPDLNMCFLPAASTFSQG